MRKRIESQSFAGHTLYIGIDVHKKSWKVTILSGDFELKTMSMDPDPAHLERYLRSHYPQAEYKAVYESGFCGFSTLRQLQYLGIDCQVIHAGDIPSTQKDRLQKTDKADSRKLAKYAQVGVLTPVFVPTPEQEAVRDLVRQRGRISKDLARVKARVKSFLNKNGITIPEHFNQGQTRNWSANYTHWLENIDHESDSAGQVIASHLREGKALREELLRVNRILRQRFTQPDYIQDYTLLLGIPGVGPVIAMTLLSELIDMDRFSSVDQLYSFVGLIPRMHQSGDKNVSTKMTKRGRKNLKVLLIEAAWTAVRKDPALHKAYLDWSKRMESNQAIVRVAKKLLNRIRHVLKTKTAYELGIVE